MYSDVAEGHWTIGGDFRLVDPGDENAPVVSITFHDIGIRSAMLDKEARKTFCAALSTLMIEMPHPYEDEAPEPGDLGE